MIIYKATNNINGKVYVGQTIRKLETRVKEHARSTKSLLGKAIRKYGIDNFTIEEIFHTEDFKELQEAEKRFIAEFNCLVPNGYNIVSGGEGTCGYAHSNESKKLMSISHQGIHNGAKNHFYGKKHSKESLLKMRGKKHLLSEEARKAISEGHPTKPVINLTTGEKFPRVKDAAKAYNVAPTNITRACKNPNRSVRGCKWSYL